MRLIIVCCSVLLVLTVFVGCQTRGIHEVPTSRDYKALEKQQWKEAQELVKEAHRVGAQHYAPYEYFSAKCYLKMACEEKAEGDRRGMRDYSILAKNMATEAIAKGSGIVDKGEMLLPEDKEHCQAEYDRLRARFNEICPAKGRLVSPILYVHIETALSHAEHELVEARQYPQAFRYLSTVEADIDTIWSQDVDKDGIVDLKDGDPWIPEDKDGYEDNDGIPEPQPYPVLSMVHFETGKATLSQDAKGYLRGLAHMLVDGYSEAKLHVDGHTDDVHTDEFNLELAHARAEAVKACLISNGAQEEQLVCAWYGKKKPIADNATKEGKAKNRRVELKLTSPKVETPYCKCSKCTAY